MFATQDLKAVLVTPPGAKVDAASVTTATIDTEGFGQASIYVILGDTDIALTALKVQESDDSGMSNAADITGLVYGTSTNPDTGSTSALPSATDDNKIYGFHINLVGRKRYLDVVVTVGDGLTGAYVTVVAFLANGKTGLYTAALRGLGANLIA